MICVIAGSAGVVPVPGYRGPSYKDRFFLEGAQQRAQNGRYHRRQTLGFEHRVTHAEQSSSRSNAFPGSLKRKKSNTQAIALLLIGYPVNCG